MDEQTESIEAPPETATPTSAAPVTEQEIKEFRERFPEAEQVIQEELAKEGIPSTRLHECSDGKHRNDEQYEIYKKYEERLELRKAQFKKDPDQFVHMDDIIMGVIQGDKGRGCIFGKYDIETCKAALVTLQIQFFTAIQEFNYKMNAKISSEKEKGLVDSDGKPLATNKSGIIS